MGFVALLGLGASHDSAADIVTFDPARLRWSELHFRASKLTVTATSEVRIDSEPVGRAAGQWLEPATGRPVSPRGDRVVRVSLQSEVLGKRSDLDLWLDPISAAAIQRTQLEAGRKVRHHRHRALRFTDSGVFHLTHRATEETVDRPWQEWTPSPDFVSFPSAVDTSVVMEPSALFYLLAVADLDQVGDRLETHVFSKGRLMRVTLLVAEQTDIKVDYLEVRKNGEERVRGRRPVVRIDLRAAPVAQEGSGKDFEFLGLRGEVEVYLEPTERIPLQISGDIRYAGRGRVRLQRAVLP